MANGTYETSLLWWIDEFKSTPGYYRWHVVGHMQDVKYPTWNGNGRNFCWSVPNLNSGGGRYAFALKAIN